MSTFNPYLVDEIVTQSDSNSSLFGLIEKSQDERVELYGYEVTMSGKLVLPQLGPGSDKQEQKLVQAIIC